MLTTLFIVSRLVFIVLTNKLINVFCYCIKPSCYFVTTIVMTMILLIKVFMTLFQYNVAVVAIIPYTKTTIYNNKYFLLTSSFTLS